METNIKMLNQIRRENVFIFRETTTHF